MEVHGQLYQVPVRSRAAKALLCLLAALLLSCGCHHPPLVRNPIRIASVPFEYGTGSSVQIRHQIRHAGVYDLHVNFRKADLPHEPDGRWPTLLKAPLRVLVLTNSTPVREKLVETLHFSSAHDPSFVRGPSRVGPAEPHITGFKAGNHVFVRDRPEGVPNRLTP
jgi:hypothetical protein